MTTRSLLPAAFLGLALVAAACGSSASSPAASSAALAATADAIGSAPATSRPATSAPATSAAATGCTAPATSTIAETEGPYYLAGAPQDADLVTAGMAGTRLTLSGTVVDTSCAPIAGARVETWQADAAGTYDNKGYTLRGWVLTDADGRFTIHTVVPGEYPGRTEHIHVKVTPPGGAMLTSQLYFPGTTANDADGIFDPSLLLAITRHGDALVGAYTFVVGG